MHGYLVQTQTGEVHLILSKQHSVFSSRRKIYKSKILSIPDITQDSAHELKLGMQTVTATLSQGQLQIHKTPFLHHTQTDQIVYFFIAGIFALLELFVLDKLFCRV